MTLRLASAIFKRVPLEIHVRDGSMTRPCATSILLLFVFFAYAWPQTEVASVFGSVTDPSGAPNGPTKRNGSGVEPPKLFVIN